MKSFVAGIISIVFSKIFPAWVVLIALCCFLIYFLHGVYKNYLIRKAEKAKKAEEAKRIEAERTSSYSNYDEDDEDEKSLARKYFDGMYNPTSSDYYKPWAYSLRDDK